MACFFLLRSSMLPLELSLNRFFPLVVPIITCIHGAGREWELESKHRTSAFMLNSHDAMACACCVTFQSHSWKLCLNKRFDLMVVFAHERERETFVVNNTKFAQLWKLFTHIRNAEPQALYSCVTYKKVASCYWVASSLPFFQVE